MSTINDQLGIYIRETSSGIQTNIGVSDPATIAQSSEVGQTDQGFNISSNSTLDRLEEYCCDSGARSEDYLIKKAWFLSSLE